MTDYSPLLQLRLAISALWLVEKSSGGTRKDPYFFLIGDGDEKILNGWQ